MNEDLYIAQSSKQYQTAINQNWTGQGIHDGVHRDVKSQNIWGLD